MSWAPWSRAVASATTVGSNAGADSDWKVLSTLPTVYIDATSGDLVQSTTSVPVDAEIIEFSQGECSV